MPEAPEISGKLRLPFAAGSRDRQGADQLAVELAKTNLDLRPGGLLRLGRAGEAGHEGARAGRAEIDIAHPDVVPVVDVSHILAAGAAGLDFDPGRPGDGLGFHSLVGIEGGDRCRPFLGRLHHRDRAIRVELQLIDAHGTFEAVASRKRGVVVEEVGLALVIHHARVVGEGALRGHDDAAVGPRAFGCGAGGVAEMLRDGTTGKKQVIEILALIEPGTLFVGCAAFFVRRDALAQGLDGHRMANDAVLPDAGVVGNHVLVQLHRPQIGIAPGEIGLALVVDVNGRIDAVVLAADQRFFEGIDVGPEGIIGHQHANAPALHRAIEIPFAIPLDRLGSPGAVVKTVPAGDLLGGPGEIPEGGDRAVLGPVHHVRRRGEHPVLHVEVVLLPLVFVVAGKQVERAVMDHRGRIGGIHRLNNRVERE